MAATGQDENSEKPDAIPVGADRFDAVIFDLDGVITNTRDAHEAAWRGLFDAYCLERVTRGDEGYPPFSSADYETHLDGKPRYDGVRDFLASRGIELPWGSPEDAPETETICGLGNRKNDHFQAWLASHRVKTYPDSLAFIEGMRGAGLRTAIISASRNCTSVLRSAGAEHLFDAQVDGNEAARLGLAGKPDPAVFLEAARRLDAAPERAVVVEDALAGVEAGSRGGFGLVVGVDRSQGGPGGHAASLRSHGADIVVEDLRALLPRDGAGHDAEAERETP